MDWLGKGIEEYKRKMEGKEIEGTEVKEIMGKVMKIVREGRNRAEKESRDEERAQMKG